MSKPSLWTRIKLNLEIAGIKLRDWIRTVIRLVGFAIILYGAFMFFEPLIDYGNPRSYRAFQDYLHVKREYIVYMFVGAAIAYFS